MVGVGLRWIKNAIKCGQASGIHVQRVLLLFFKSAMLLMVAADQRGVKQPTDD